MPEAPTTRMGLVASSGGDQINTIDDAEQTLVQLIDQLTVFFKIGTLALRPPAGIDGRLYRATDTSQIFYDNGTDWIELQTVAAAQASQFQTGDLKIAAYTTPNTGWLLCDGSAVSRTAYAALFAKLGTIHGAGNGTTTFNVPDLRDAAAFGASSAHPLGEKGGAATVALTAAQIPAHSHPDNIAYAAAGSHIHSFTTDLQSAVGGANQLPFAIGDIWAALHYVQITSSGEFVPLASSIGNTQGPHAHTGDTNANGTHSHTKSGGVQANTGGGGAHENMPPNQRMNYFIKT